MNYEPLQAYLRHHDGDEWRASFAEVERVLGFDLPDGARRSAAWWSNAAGGPDRHARAWLDAGYETSEIDVSGHRLSFRRIDAASRAGGPGQAALPAVMRQAVKALDRRKRVRTLGIAALGGGAVAAVAGLALGAAGFALGRFVRKR